jgi:hypothetical protein
MGRIARKECRVDEPALLLVRESNSVLHTNDFPCEQIGAGLPELAAFFNRDHAGGPRVWVHPDTGR